MWHFLRCLVIAVGLVLIVASQSLAGFSGERVLAFDSNILVRADATLLVIETIHVMAEGNKIKRGIYRDFPTNYADRNGQTHLVGFQVISVTRDGHSENYHVESRANGQRVYIGSADHFLAYGEHHYTLTYLTDHQLGFFTDHDELYWNVTGNGWEFPIDSASASIALPSQAAEKVQQVQGWIGAQGSRDVDVTVSRDSDNRVIFTANKALTARQGLTVAVAWPKGIVIPPQPVTENIYQEDAGFWASMSEKGAIILAWVVFMVIMFYYILVWVFFGKDPAKGVIVPLFNPPRGMSPAMVRYIYKMKYDKKAFAAAILGLAARGYYKVKERKPSGFWLEKTGKEVLNQGLEEVAVQRMTLALPEFELSNNSCDSISVAYSEVEDALQRQEGRSYFLLNREYFWFGAVMTAGYGLFCPGISTRGDGASFWCFLLGGCLLVVNVVFFYLLRAPTVMGRCVMDQIEGFRLFLSVAEQDQLKSFKSPERTPELFAKYLPFALALDVEQAWAQQFAAVFERLHPDDEAYSPYWYASGGFAEFGHSFTSQIESSLTPPGSSSAFGSDSGSGFSGGFSGGGGGGGGGGGW